MEKTFIVTDPVGLHARPATLLVNEASKYVSDIKIISGEKEGNLKSIMGAMALGIATGTEMVVSAEGDDAAEALEGISKVVVESEIGKEK